MLSDEELNFSKALDMPKMVVEEMTLLKRITLVINEGFIRKVFYPVFPPHKNALEVISYLSSKNKNSW